MTSAVILLADGFETIEALAALDVLRRAGVRVQAVSVGGSYQVMSAQQVQVFADERIDTVDFDRMGCLVIPGGIVAVRRLHTIEAVRVELRRFMERGVLAASGTAPALLADLGLLAGRRATVLPGHEGSLPAESLAAEPVVVDGNLITARSAFDAVAWGVAIVRALAGDEVARQVAQGLGGPSAEGDEDASAGGEAR